jgi:hypothetical protein
VSKPKIVFYGGLIYSDRAILYNPEIKVLTDKYDIELWTQYASVYKSDLVKIRYAKLVGNLEKPWYLKYLRYINTAAHDKKYNSRARLFNKREAYKSVLGISIYCFGLFIYYFKLLEIFEKLISKVHILIVKDSEFEQLLDKVKPSVVILTWPYRASNVTLASICKGRGISTVASVLGIDNLTTKERMLDIHDHYWVWSGYMESQLKDMYVSVGENRVFRVGAIQYGGLIDFSKKRLIGVYNCSDERIKILFCLGSPNLIQEHHVLIDLLKYIKEGKHERDFFLLIRPHPGFSDDKSHSDMLAQLQRSYYEFCQLQDCISNVNDDFMAQWSSAISEADIVISCNSTLLIDSVISRKRTWNINFSSNVDTHRLLNEEIAHWHHVMDMQLLLPLKNLSSFDELTDSLNNFKLSNEKHKDFILDDDDINKIEYLSGINLKESNLSKCIGKNYCSAVSQSLELLLETRKVEK